MPLPGLVLGHFEFEEFRTVMPALRLRSGQAPAGIQGEQAAACGYSAWIPAFAGMTQPSSTPQNHHDGLLALIPPRLQLVPLFHLLISLLHVGVKLSERQ